MDETFFQSLASQDWSERISALASLKKALTEAQNEEELHAIQSCIDRVFQEDEDTIYTVEILILREFFCDHSRSIGGSSCCTKLLYYLQDRLPDTHHNPDFSVSGSHWSNPSKWKVRIAAAHAIGVIGDKTMIPMLKTLLLTEHIPLVRRALVLAIVSLSTGHQSNLQAYLYAYMQRDPHAGRKNLDELFENSDAQWRSYHQEIIHEIGV